MRWHRTGRSGQRSANGAMLQTMNLVRPTARTQTAHTHAHVDVPLGDKGTSHGTADSVIVLTYRITDRCPPILSACMGEPSARKETSLNILDFVARRDYPQSSGQYIQSNCLGIPLSSTDELLNAKGVYVCMVIIDQCVCVECGVSLLCGWLWREEAG